MKSGAILMSALRFIEKKKMSYCTQLIYYNQNFDYTNSFQMPQLSPPNRLGGLTSF